MKVYRLLLPLLLLLVAVESRKAHTYHERRWKVDVPMADCSQVQPNCRDCLAKSECVWCATDSSAAANGECRKSANCQNSRTTCDPPASDDQRGERKPENVLNRAFDARNVQNATTNATVLCAEASREGCGACAKNEFCFWCHSNSSCNNYFNGTTAKETCPTGSWYKHQCIYPVGVTPCPKRNRSCHDCLTDNLCYWCESTDTCAFYPLDKYTPPHCPRDRVYHKECPYVGSLLLVLLPILAIILVPVFIYFSIWMVCCCMRFAGYEPLGDDSDQGPPGERKHREGIRLKSGSPSNRTDTLRKKYKLDNP